jgi:SET domain-containing protein
METPFSNDAIGDKAVSAESELVIFKNSPIHGTGAFAKSAIPKGCRVIEYLGRKISKAESLRLCEEGNEFIFDLNEEQDLDGKVPWNPARLINHGCAPNCDAELEADRAWIVASRDIATGEEITYNYNFDLADYKEHPCRCGSPDCVGYMVAEEFFDHVRKQPGMAQATTL